MAMYVGLDFETYSGTDLPKHGLERYVNDPDFQPLIGAAAIRDDAGFLQRQLQFDFVRNYKSHRLELAELLTNARPLIPAHNAGFEQRVLDWMEIPVRTDQFIDSAVVARAAGAGSKLEEAAPQLLGVNKLASGGALIKRFSIPGPYQERNGNKKFDPQIIDDYPDEWFEFNRYCMLDAKLSLRLVEEHRSKLTRKELHYQMITMEMNRRGWRVDIETVQEMQRRYLENQAAALSRFRIKHNATDLNFNSLKQLKEWCADRGIRATSFDEQHVAKLKARIEQKIWSLGALSSDKIKDYTDVLDLLNTKQILGGSSLKKLQTILDTVGPDPDNPGEFRLRDQYLHAGAGQTLRTSGRSVQMQNLKRLSTPADMGELMNDDTEWDNTQLAENLRQVFTATHPLGFLIVGDFSSVESRGLAWLAGEDWKTRAYFEGKDLYKVLAGKIYGARYEMISKIQRQTGKVGELSCGYGAGPGAVQAFAANMGVEMSEGEATKLVVDWRDANPKIEAFWEWLNNAMHRVIEMPSVLEAWPLPDGFLLQLQTVEAPPSLQQQVPGVRTLRMSVRHPNGEVFLVRYFHGVHKVGRNVRYFKPSTLKSGDLWKNRYMDPKTKQWRFYELYGGKLAGILTQSFCRELFFMVLANVYRWSTNIGVGLVGQFHDEIVLDWGPDDGLSLETTERDLNKIMSDPGPFKSFPLAAEIKHDYRYTK